MVYYLDNQIDLERFRARCASMERRGSRVELTEVRGQRTYSQNRYMHLIIDWFAVESGNRRDYVKREYFKKLVNSEIFVRVVVDNMTGEEVEVLRSSADLDVGEMQEAITRFRDWAAEEGIYLPSSDEDEKLTWIDSRIGMYSQYL